MPSGSPTTSICTVPQKQAPLWVVVMFSLQVESFCFDTQCFGVNGFGRQAAIARSPRSISDVGSHVMLRPAPFSMDETRPTGQGCVASLVLLREPGFDGVKSGFIDAAQRIGRFFFFASIRGIGTAPGNGGIALSLGSHLDCRIVMRHRHRA